MLAVLSLLAICVALVHGSKGVCNKPKDPGPCRAAFPRWFYNAQTGQCEQFIYGGCRGNRNNFETEDDCIARCGSEQCKKLPDGWTKVGDAEQCLTIRFLCAEGMEYWSNECGCGCRPSTVEEEACTKGGCSGELCVDPDSGVTVGICVFKCEYQCLQYKQCGRDADNQCAWLAVGDDEEAKYNECMEGCSV